jgi:hypothetical protein
VGGDGANWRTYIRRCIQERQVDLIEEDIQDLLETGMRNTDTSLPSLSNERLIDRLVEVLLDSEWANCRCGGHFSVLLYHTLKPSFFPLNNTPN